MADHNHEDYATAANVICQECGKRWEICAYCNETWHDCKLVKSDLRLIPGYRVVPEFPEYMVNKQATVRHIQSQRYCMLVRVSKSGGAMVPLQKNGKKYTRAAQELRDSAFADELG
jgi:hypothetical protein